MRFSFCAKKMQKTSTLDILVYLKKRICDEDLRRCIRLLRDEGYIAIAEDISAYIRVIPTHKGRYFDQYEQAEYKEFFMKSIFTPILVALITTLITLWLNGLFTF